jgi:hypothetical protein
MSLFFSADGTHNIGAFDHGSGLIRYGMSDEARALEAAPDSIDVYLSSEEGRETLHRLLLEITSEVHEKRHYMDVFGTFAGISAYATQLEVIKEFVAVTGALKGRSQPIITPLTDWIRLQDCPKEVRNLSHMAQIYGANQQVFFGTQPRIMEEGAVDAVWVDVPAQIFGRKIEVPIPAFPLTFSYVYALSGKVIPGSQSTSYYPLGFLAIVEGSAHALARTMAERIFPKLPHDFLVRRAAMPTNDKDGRDAQDLVNSIMPYDITDLMVTKYAKRVGLKNFNRDLMLHLADIALASSYVHVERPAKGTFATKFSMPGNEFVAIMSQMSRDDVERGTVDFPDAYAESYAQLASRYRRGDTWEHVNRQDSVESAVWIWETFVVHNVTAPLLELRGSTQNRVFVDHEFSVATATNTNLPRVEVKNGRMEFHHIPPRVKVAWLRQHMLKIVAGQYLRGGREICCPIATNETPGMWEHVVVEGGCERNKAMGCGRWNPTEETYRPKCLFTECLSTYGFLPT